MGVIPDLADMFADLSEDELIVPRRHANEVLENFATHATMVSDRLASLARERRQLALENVPRVSCTALGIGGQWSP